MAKKNKPVLIETAIGSVDEKECYICKSAVLKLSNGSEIIISSNDIKTLKLASMELIGYYFELDEAKTKDTYLFRKESVNLKSVK